MRAQGNLSDNMLRRHFLKRTVVSRRKQTTEMEAMAAEDRASRFVGAGWTQQWREQNNCKLMALQVCASTHTKPVN